MYPSIVCVDPVPCLEISMFKITQKNVKKSASGEILKIMYPFPPQFYRDESMTVLGRKCVLSMIKKFALGCNILWR